jgi:hypothetical protein
MSASHGTTRLRATAYRGLFRQSSPWWWVGGGVLVSLVASFFVLSSPHYSSLIPFIGLPVFIPFIVMLLTRSRSKSIDLELTGRQLALRSGRTVWSGTLELTEVAPWLLVGVGTRQGVVVVLRARSLQGEERGFSLAAPGAVANLEVDANPGNSDPDMFVTALDLEALVEHLRSEALLGPAAPRRGRERNPRFALVRRPGALNALKASMLWFAMMLVIGVSASVVGERFGSAPVAIAFLGLLSVVLVVVFIRRAMTVHRQEKPRFDLAFVDGQWGVYSQEGELVSSAPGQDAGPCHETYVYVTRYTTSRFPMLRFGSGRHGFRVAVWDPQYVNPAAPVGAAPEFLMGLQDWQRLQLTLAQPAGGDRFSP